MRRQIRPQLEDEHHCEDCVHAVLEMIEFLDNKKRAILCKCKHQSKMMLLHHSYCDNFKQKNK